jgi:hypothetical protein
VFTSKFSKNTIVALAIAGVLIASTATYAIASSHTPSSEFPSAPLPSDTEHQYLAIPTTEFIWLKDHRLRNGDAIFLMDTSPYGVDAHFAAMIPCEPDGTPKVKLVNFAETLEIEAHLEYDPDGPHDHHGYASFIAEPEEVAEASFINLPMNLIYPNKPQTMTEEEYDALEDTEDNEVDEEGSEDPVYDTAPNGEAYIEAYHLDATLDGINEKNFNPGLGNSCIYHITAENVSDVFLVNDSGKDVKFNYNDHIIYDVNKMRHRR